ncbi:MAG TPA: hypothetical protein VFU56_02665 [Gaiellaceae bacterium]|nr:hypothetical protein [Gaiellaceae bacterium]
MTVRALLVSLVLALPTGGPATAGSAPGLSVWPVRLALAPGGTTVVHVANGGRRAALVDVGIAGFTLDLRGTPRVVTRSGGTRLLAVGPQRLVVPSGGTRTFEVRAARRSRLGPGDHPALVLLSARSAGGAGIGVRVRIGLTVEVRVPGALHQRVVLGRLRVRARTLTLVAANRGNVAERVTRSAFTVRLVRRRRVVATLRPRPRDLLPGTRGLVEFVLPRRLHGPVVAAVSSHGLPVGGRSYRVSL